MELSNTRIVPAPPAAVWDALNDPAVLQACIPGCESFARTGDNAYALVMSARIGPVAARFNGKMTMSDIDAPNGYTLNFEGQGGAAGFARGEARVSLAREGEQHTALTYVAKAQVGGKLAQVGSRLIDGVAAKMGDEFFSRFCSRFTPPRPAVGDTATIAAPSAPAAADVKQENAMLTPPGGSQWIRYAAIAALVVVLIVLYARSYR
jgi:carbon monoxide dehydrogenase subunit G